MDFTVPADYEIKVKKRDRREKYLDFAKELMKLWNVQVPVPPNGICILGMISKVLERGLEGLEIGGRIETIQSLALLRLVRIPPKSFRDLRRLTVNQIPVWNHQLTLV